MTSWCSSGGVRWDSVSSEVIQKFFSTTEEKHAMTNDDKYDSPPLLTMFGSPGFIAQERLWNIKPGISALMSSERHQTSLMRP